MAEIIEMSSEAVEELVFNKGSNSFKFVEGKIDRDNAYKDYAPAEWIFKRLSDDTFWCATGSAHVGHYAYGNDHYWEDLIRVQRVEEALDRKVWKAV